MSTRRISWTGLVPVAAVLAIAGVLSFGLGGQVTFTVEKVTFMPSSTMAEGSYFDLGRTSQSIFLTSCDDPQTLLIIPQDVVALEIVQGAPKAPSFWEIIRPPRPADMPAARGVSRAGAAVRRAPGSGSSLASSVASFFMAKAPASSDGRPVRQRPFGIGPAVTPRRDRLLRPVQSVHDRRGPSDQCTSMVFLEPIGADP
jgi:hypothetical protein